MQLKAPFYRYFRDCLKSKKGVGVTSNAGTGSLYNFSVLLTPPRTAEDSGSIDVNNND